MNILVVDDESDFRECLVGILTSLNFKVTEARDGDEALKIVNQKEKGFFDLLCTDINMPKMDGISLIKEVNDLVHGIKSYVILSGRIADEKALNKQLSELSAPFYFLEKPFTFSTFEDLIKKILDDVAIPST
jgi:two-component system, chemotaxis family, chemotaxis protein CheY